MVQEEKRTGTRERGETGKLNDATYENRRDPVCGSGHDIGERPTTWFSPIGWELAQGSQPFNESMNGAKYGVHLACQRRESSIEPTTERVSYGGSTSMRWWGQKSSKEGGSTKVEFRQKRFYKRTAWGGQ